MRHLRCEGRPTGSDEAASGAGSEPAMRAHPDRAKHEPDPDRERPERREAGPQATRRRPRTKPRGAMTTDSVRKEASFTPSEDSSSEIPPDSSRHKKGPTKPVRQPIRQPRSISGRIVRGLRRPITQTHEGLPRSFHPSGNRPFGERSRTAARKKERLSNKFF